MQSPPTWLQPTQTRWHCLRSDVSTALPTILVTQSECECEIYIYLLRSYHSYAAAFLFFHNLSVSVISPVSLQMTSFLFFLSTRSSFPLLPSFLPAFLSSSRLPKFSLRYFVNTTFWDREGGGPIFFYTGNEAPISAFIKNTGTTHPVGSPARISFTRGPKRFWEDQTGAPHPSYSRGR